MIPLAVPNLAGREKEYLQECIETTFVSTVGPFVERFEKMVAEASGVGYGVALSSGTTALHLAMVSIGVGRDDLVILPSFTFVASANSIAHCGAIPWLFDVDPGSWTIDVNLLEETLAKETERNRKGLVYTRTGQRVAAIMPVHTLGLPADMDAVMRIAKDYGLPVIADASRQLGRFRLPAGDCPKAVPLGLAAAPGNREAAC